MRYKPDYGGWENVQYARIYVVSYLGMSTEVIDGEIYTTGSPEGAIIKYQAPFKGSDETIKLPNDTLTFGASGGKYDLVVENKNVLFFSAKSSEKWCSIAQNSSNTFTISVEQNYKSDARTATITLTTAYNRTATIIVNQAKGSSGTLEDPYPASAALYYGNLLARGEVSADYIYIKGKVVSIQEQFTTQSGIGTFYISDDGTTANRFYVYRVNYLGNRKFANGDTQIKMGDEVIICGKIANYYGTIMTDQNSNCFLYSLNGENRGGEPKHAIPTGNGTLASPFNAIAALNYGKSLASGEVSADFIYIKGKVASIKEEFTTQYGNGTFYISEDGTSANQFYVYRVYYLGNKKFASGDTQIKEGDEVIICGKITNYNGTIETAQNSNSFLYSLNGENRGGEPKPATPAADPTGDGTQASPYNVSALLKYIATLGSDIESPSQVYVKGKVSQVKEEFTKDYGNGTFYISDDGTASNEFYVFRTLYLGNKKFVNGDTQIQVGDEVIICGNVVNFKGNTPETVQNKSYLYSLNGAIENGGGQPDPSYGGKGVGTEADPFNVQAIINYVSSLPTDVETQQGYYVKGIVTNIPNNGISTQNNNLSFYISDDKSASNSFYVFRAKGLNGGNVIMNMIKVGDEVVIFGSTWINYRGNTPETKPGESYIVSINGKGESGGEQPGGDTPATSLTNGDFETWVDGLPTGWKSASSASSATLSQSTDAHGGSYSVNVNGKEGGNVRLASQEIKLAAGTYVFSFYAKATTADAAQVRPGHVPVADGKVGSYVYGDYTTLSNASWTLVSCEFTLDAETTVCLVVMNPKKSNYSSGKDVLVDDATLIKK